MSAGAVRVETRCPTCPEPWTTVVAPDAQEYGDPWGTGRVTIAHRGQHATQVFTHEVLRLAAVDVLEMSVRLCAREVAQRARCLEFRAFRPAPAPAWPWIDPRLGAFPNPA